MNAERTRILVVDDEFGMREGCRKVLAAEGFEVETAEDGAAGLEVFTTRGNFAAALIDMKMPRMSGLELIEQIRRVDEDIVLLVITAYATIETAVEATKQGAYGYIPKPFTPDELLLSVRNGLERRTLTMEARKLRLDRDNRLLEVAFERSKCNTIINCMTDGVLVVNRERQIVLRNAAAVRAIPRLAGLPVPSPLSEMQCPSFQAILDETIGAGGGPMILSRELSLDGNTYMVSASPVVETSGASLGAVTVLRDITALKKLEQAKSTFVSMVAHEIRSPLAAVEAYLSLILSDGATQDPAELRNSLERAVARTQALRNMVSELISLTAMETGKFTITRVPLSIKQSVREAMGGHAPKAKAKQIDLMLQDDLPPSQEAVLADRNALTSILTNLLDNAIKFTPPKGHVTVQISTDGTQVDVKVRDDGVGMSPEDAERAFDEFFRAKNEYTASVPGTGLGLAIVKRLVEMHNGRVVLRTAQGRGTEFTVSLPFAE
jgi:two-component system, OmpR family, phosphate regulon sensor histidine kinase PhoR